MQLEKELAKASPEKNTLVTIGVFDGVHIGHQNLLRRLVDEAHERGLTSAVITFRSHPEKIVHPGNQLPWLIDLDERIRIINNLGVEIIVAIPFTAEISRLSAREFVQLLIKHMKMKGMIIGPDFALGSKREGNSEYLGDLAIEMGFSLENVPPFVLDEGVVSSSAIRQTLAEGNVKKAEKLLGRSFRIDGLVTTGDQQGRLLGFPTANIIPNPEFIVPKDGVYTTVTQIDNVILPSITNIGVRPTFGGSRRLIETYLLDYEGDLYNRYIKIDFINRLRDEQRFETIDGLKAQMAKDVEHVRGIFSTINP
jgi:riboflavin kinase/FMN adenylyltransferase